MRILIAYDGSPAGQGVLHSVPALFPEAQARVLTVYEGPLEMEIALASAGGVGYVGLDDASWQEFEDTSQGEALATAQGAAKGLADAGLTADAEVARARGEAGTVAGVLEAAEAWDADVIATGTRGRGGLKRVLLGSTSTALLHRADRPVLVVPGDAATGDGPVLVAYDGSGAARAAVETTARLVPGRTIVVLNVWTSPDYAVGVMAGAGPPIDMAPKVEGWMTEQSAASANEGVQIAEGAGATARGRSDRIAGSLHEGILDIAEAEGAVLLVTGSRGRGGVTSVLLGSVSAGLVHSAQIPTMVVPDPEHD